MSGSLESAPVGRAEPIHIQPTAELAERVLLPGDPGRALALAQLLLEKPLMFNHNRGLWGYTGRAADGELLSIQSTGMGGPSAAIVLHELAQLGAKRAIRVGTCGALNGELGLGELVIAGEAIAADGTSRALGAGERVSGDVTLTQALALAPSETLRRHADATIVSTDLFYEPRGEIELHWREQGAVAVEMEAATLFAAGARAGVAVACALVVSDLLGGVRRERIAAEPLQQAAEAMGRLAVAALSG
jgi:DeoD family purine-nucleoside phosphorylase